MRLTVLLSLLLAIPSVTHGGVIDFLSDSFTYPDGTVVGNAGWYNPTAVPDMVVDSGKLVTSNLNAEHIAEHQFSRMGFDNAPFKFEIEVNTTRHNQAVTLINSNTRQRLSGFSYVDVGMDTGWNFDGIQTNITGDLRLEILVNPLAETLQGLIFDRVSDSLLFSSTVNPAAPGAIATTNAVNIYGDARGAPSDAVWDNVRLSANVPTAVPEPSTFAIFGLGLAGFGAVQYRRRKKAAAE